MKAIKKLVNGCTVESLHNDILATIGAWLTCIAAGGVYWLLVRHEGVCELWLGVTVMAGIELLIDGVMLEVKRRDDD